MSVFLWSIVMRVSSIEREHEASFSRDVVRGMYRD